MDRGAVGEAAGGTVERLRMNRIKHRIGIRDVPFLNSRNYLPKEIVPGYPSAARRCHVGPSSSHNHEGTRLGHVRAANADNFGGERAGVRGSSPCAGAERAADSLEGCRGQACVSKTLALKTWGGKAGGQSCCGCCG